MDLDWAVTLLDAALGGRMQARRGELIDALGDGGVVATAPDGAPAGLACWHRDGAASAEITCLAVEASRTGRGVGRALLDAAESALRSAGVRHVWLVTTNDNLGALALYQKAGYRLVALRPGAIEELRRTVKPSIGEVGEHGIPIRDELELSKDL